MIGYRAGYNNTSGTTNTYIGYNAGYTNSTNWSNTMIGYSAGNLTNAADNTIMGARAGYNNATGTGNVIIGDDAGFNSKSSKNVLIGTDAGLGSGTNSNATQNENTLIGFQAGTVQYGSNNTMLGSTAGASNTSGADNTFIGRRAGNANTTYSNNTFVGSGAGYLTNINSNTFVGSSAGYNNVTGYGNVMMGDLAGYNFKSSRNVLIGSNAGFGDGVNTSQDDNTLVGNLSGNVTYGASNTMLGSSAGLLTSSGYSNIFIGKNAGYTTTTGYGNVFLGNFARAEGTSKTTLNNATAIGWAAVAIRNRTMILGDTTVNIQVGIGTAWPTQKLTVKGNFAFVAYNDGMFYKNKRFLFQDEQENIALGTNHEENFEGKGNLLLGVNSKLGISNLNNSTAIGNGATVSVNNGLVLGSQDIFVGIGTSAPTARLEVASGKDGESGLLFTNLKQNQNNQYLTVNQKGEVILQKQRTQISKPEEWSDKVFEQNYLLKPLNEVENFVKINKHLPNLPSAQEMTEKGIENDKLSSKFLEKIEELTFEIRK
jgi:trimeric autotransporter adhesin